MTDASPWGRDGTTFADDATTSPDDAEHGTAWVSALMMERPTTMSSTAAPSSSAAAAAGSPEAITLRRTVVIPNSRGLHARAAAKLVALAERYCACVAVVRDGERVPACSIMGLMMLGAGKGSTVTVEAEGWDAREALDAVAGLVEAGFHED